MEGKSILGLSYTLVKLCFCVLFYCVSCVFVFSFTPEKVVDRANMLRESPEAVFQTPQNGFMTLNDQEVQTLFEDILNELTTRGSQLQEAAETISALSAANERLRAENDDLVRYSEAYRNKALKAFGLGLLGGVLVAFIVGGPVLYGTAK